jgi:hypothetical protein
VTPEGKVKLAVAALLTEYQAWFFKPVSNGMGVHGIPDFIGCRAGSGSFFGIETKAGKGKMTALQERQKVLIEKAEGRFFLVNEVDGLKELEEWLNELQD